MKNNPFAKDAPSWIGDAKFAIHAIADVMEIGITNIYVTLPPLEEDDDRWLVKWKFNIRQTDSEVEGATYWLEAPTRKDFRAAIKRQFAFEVASRIIPEARYIHMAISAYAVDQTHPLPAHFIVQVMHDTQLKIAESDFKITFSLKDIIGQVIQNLEGYAIPPLEIWFDAVKKDLKKNPPQKKNP